jgi:hypothetical protein
MRFCQEQPPQPELYLFRWDRADRVIDDLRAPALSLPLFALAVEAPDHAICSTYAGFGVRLSRSIQTS